MAVVDKTIPTDTALFASCLGIKGADALKAICVLMGETRDIGSLERLRDLVLWGCFSNESALRGALYDAYGDDVNAEYCKAGIDALVALRTYNMVSTKEFAAKYCGDMWDAYFGELERQLGAEVPEWFFPALAILARQSTYNTDFERRIFRVLMIWRIGCDMYDVPRPTLARTLAAAWRPLSQYELGEDDKWRIFYPEEDDSYEGGGYQEF
jgi:hypothetical protein